MEQGASTTPMDGETRDANTPMQEADGDAEMTPSEVGREDHDLRDIVEREGIDLSNILEQWKRQGVDNVPVDKLDRIQYLFLLREEEKSRGLKHMHGEIVLALCNLPKDAEAITKVASNCFDSGI